MASGEWSAETPDNELQALEHEAAALEAELERVRARLHELNETEKHST
jgi:prefoldin subunit 5